jgi:subtilisin family serine protease
VGEEQDYDGNGHGTHVAGTVGSTKYGIAKKATLVAVKVLSASGSGSTVGVIDGVEWTCKDHTEKKNKCVANMSLGGGKSDAMNRAVDELSACGCATAVASGNEARDACLGSPASSEKVYTVNSMDTEGGFRVPRVSCLLSV